MKYLFLFLLVVGASFAATNISSCQVINSGGVYYLNESFISNETNCINITVSHVLLDGQGYTISNTAAASTYSVAYTGLAGISNITVQNINLVGFPYGISIYYNYFPNRPIIIQNNNITNSSTAAIYVFSLPTAYNVLIANNNITSGNQGILVLNIANTNITANTISSMSYGIKTLGSYCNISQNSFNLNTNAIWENGNGNNYSQNNFSSNTYTFFGGSSIGNGFFYNNTINDTNNVLSTITGSLFFNTTIGNNWTSYTGYDTDGDSFGNSPYQIYGTYYDYLPLTDRKAGYFISPTPASGSISPSALTVRFNFTIYNMTNCQVEFNGVNYSASFIDNATNNYTCEANFTLSAAGASTYKGWVNVSGTYYPMNESSRTVCYQYCSAGGGGSGTYIPPAIPTTPTTTTVSEIAGSGSPTLPDLISDITGGNVIPITNIVCTPYWSQKTGLSGLVYLDIANCEAKGIESLYIPRLYGFSSVWFWLILSSAILIKFAKEKKYKLAISIFMIYVFLQGIDFIFFAMTAYILNLAKYAGVLI